MPGRRLISDAEATSRGFGGPEAVRRRQVLCETLGAFESSKPADRYQQLAAANLESWHAQKSVAAPRLRVQVLPGDWGEVTHQLTRTHGICFAVLNMASAFVPGGAYVEGAVAQEENIFRRSDCHFSIGEDEFDADLDRYVPAMTRLVSGRDGSVYLDAHCPRVCIRGPEDRFAPDLGYQWLADDQIFPFFELRAAAQDLRTGAHFDPADARRRIAAQLDTLRLAGIRHAVLGASGCGAFRNPSHQVAVIYGEEIDARRVDFDVIAFAIFSAGYGPGNFGPFSDVLAEGGDLTCQVIFGPADS